jgi:hypothetical protein
MKLFAAKAQPYFKKTLVAMHLSLRSMKGFRANDLDLFTYYKHFLGIPL